MLLKDFRQAAALRILSDDEFVRAAGPRLNISKHLLALRYVDGWPWLMTINVSTLANAADGLLETALVGGDWRAPLATFASAAAAKGATLVRHDPLDRLRSQRLDEFVLSTDSIAEPVADYLAGTAPPDPRSSRVSPTMDAGFLTDLDQFSLEEIDRNPFYEEFLRGRGLRWHACARVDSSYDHADLYISLKRTLGQDHYTPAETTMINDTLPKVRMAAAISRAILQSESRGMKRALEARSEALFEFDVRGRVVSFNQAADRLAGNAMGLHNCRLYAPLREEQARLDRTIAAPLAAPPQVACTVLRTATPGRRLVFRALPVVGAARDIFVATTALAVVTVWEKPDIPPKSLVCALRDSFDLTAAEARVASLVGLGVTLADAARILEISVGTTRNYFKAAQSKIGVSRQAELASLVALMRV